MASQLPEQPGALDSVGATRHRRSTDSHGAILFCDPFEIDGRSFELRRDGVRVSLPHSVFRAILYLAKHRDRVVPGHELIEALWGQRAINEMMVPWTMSRARKALGQNSSDKQPIETVRSRGYRFTGIVRSIASGDTPHVVSTAPNPVCRNAPERALRPPLAPGAAALDPLLTALDDAIARRGRLCLVTENVPVERARRVSDLAAMANRLGLSVWVGRCREREAGHPFAPWKQVIRDALIERTVGRELEGQLRALLDEPSMSRVPPPPSMAGSRTGNMPVEHFWVLERLSWLLFRVADLAPRVVIVEDVHLADEASLHLLVFIAAELSRFAVLVVATAESSSQESEAWAKAALRLAGAISGPAARQPKGQVSLENEIALSRSFGPKEIHAFHIARR